MFKRFVILLAAAGAGFSGQAAGAEEASNRTNYTISLSGLPLANAQFQAHRNGATYSIDAQIASTGIGDFLADTKAEMSSAGKVKDGVFSPEKFLFRYKYGKKNRLFETRFQGGDVVSSVIEPQQKKRRKGWIDLKPADLLSVTDPVAGLVIPEDTDPCRSKIAVYDGETRLDLKLARKREEPFRTEGFEGSAVVCNIRYVPKAGYRKGHKDLDYVSKLTTMEIWFAKSSEMKVYAPVFLSVPTKYGTLTVIATHFDG
jgi:hypothetical protein